MPRFETTPAKNPRAAYAIPVSFIEVEREGSTLMWCSGSVAQTEAATIKTKEFATEDDAQHAYGVRVRRSRYRGFNEVGPSVAIPGHAPARPPGSALLIQEFLESGDARLLDEVLHFHEVAQLGAIGERWFNDPRPEMRAMLMQYIDDGCARRGHKALVKCVFKLAEAGQDDELMVHFMVAFDRLSRRTLGAVGGTWDRSLQRWVPNVGLRVDWSEQGRLRKEGDSFTSSLHFSRATRLYLRRRVFRYFRRMGHQDIRRYAEAVPKALTLYRDAHLDSPAKLLDSWSLMHILYGYSDVIHKRRRGLVLQAGRAFGEFKPAPYFAIVWDHAFDVLVSLLLRAPARTVRHWSLGMLRDKYAPQLRALPWEHVRTMLLSSHEDLAALGAELLPNHPGTNSLTVASWLALLEQQDLDVLAAVAAEMQRCVTPSRLTLAQCIDLARAPTASIANLGFVWAKTKSLDGEAALREVLRLASARTASVRTAAAPWLRELLCTRADATLTHARDLCDAQFPELRSAGLAVVKERFAHEGALWFALAESPYNDVCEVVLANVKVWQGAAAPNTLAHLWTTVILNVHRGGVTKGRVPLALAERLLQHEEEADVLLPILGLALRSVRAPERASALGALARLVANRPALRVPMNRHLPEIAFTEQVSA